MSESPRGPGVKQEDPPFRDVQEMLLDVWTQLKDFQSLGLNPSLATMTKDQYKRLRLYHTYLGSLPEDAPDYLGEDELFGLEICLEQGDKARVVEP